jgi:four helix bundle protein
MRSHRTLAAWQEGDAVAKGVLRLAKVHWQPYAAALINQLQRASLSVPLNIAEGYAAGGRRTFIRHLRIAYGSAIESGEILRMLLDLDDFSDADVEPLLERCRRSQRLLLGLILVLDRDPNRSPFPVPRSPITPARSS